MVEDAYTRITNPIQVQELIEDMAQPGGAFLLLSDAQGQSASILIEHIDKGKTLTLNITAAKDYLSHLLNGKSFRIRRAGGQGVILTPKLTAYNFSEQNQRLCCDCDYPEYLDHLQRRSDFRAPAHPNMGIVSRLKTPNGQLIECSLLDLSVSGCQLEFEQDQKEQLADKKTALSLTLDFPNGSQFQVFAYPRHAKDVGNTVQCGFIFEIGSDELLQEVTHLVREIEREHRLLSSSGGASSFLQSSALFMKPD